MALASLPAHGADDARNPDTEIASSRGARSVCGRSGSWMRRTGAVEAESAELKQTHNR